MPPASLLPFPTPEDHSCETAALRLRRCGAAALSQQELLELLIGPRTGALFAAARDRGHELLQLDYRELRARDVDDSEAVAFLACVELARRFARSRIPDRLKLDHAAALASYLILRYARSDQEVLGAVYLDLRRRLICDEILYRGTLGRIRVEPRAILRRGLALNAPAFVLFPEPSVEDLSFTRRVSQAAEIVGLELCDHLVLGSGNWISFAERDLLRAPPSQAAGCDMDSIAHRYVATERL